MYVGIATTRVLSVIHGYVCAMQDFFLIIFLHADRLWWPNALARLFEFRAGFLVPSRAWGSYLFSPFHRSTDYFLGTIDRVRKERTYNRDSLINDESAAIEIYRRYPVLESNTRLHQIPFTAILKNYCRITSIRERPSNHPYLRKIQTCPFTLTAFLSQMPNVSENFTRCYIFSI